MSFFIVVVLILLLLLAFMRTGSASNANARVPATTPHPETLKIAKIPGTGEYMFEIVGESNYQTAIASICGGVTEDGANKFTEATLYLEDDNKYDNQAVRVEIEGKTVGYLSRENARLYREKLSSIGLPNLTGICGAVIRGGWDRGPEDKGNFGVKLDMVIE
jgi:hypothetical protein